MDAYKANLKQTANQEVPKTFRKQELTEKSRLELEAGGTVKVSGLVDKKGKAYQGYITWKPGEKPAFMFPKDYKAALVAGHTLKGVAGNLGLTALYQACSQMVEHFRGNSVAAACDAYCTVQAEYAQIYELLLHAGR